MNWIKVKTVRPTKNTDVLFWHNVWKCPVAGKITEEFNDGSAIVHEKTLTTQWPLKAFSHWTTMPKAPTE